MLVGCSTNPDGGEVDQGGEGDQGGTSVVEEVRPTLTYYDIVDQLPEGMYEEILEGTGTINLDMFHLIGTNMPDAVFETYDANTFSTSSTNGKVMYEVVASWCDFCKGWSKDVAEEFVKNNEDIQVVQVFIDGDKEAVEEFYKSNGLEIGKYVVVPEAEETVDVFYNQLGIYSFPSFIFVNEEGVITWVANGYSEYDLFNYNVELAFGENSVYGRLDTDFVDQMHRTYKDIKSELRSETLKSISEYRPEGWNDSGTKDYYDAITLSDLNKDLSFDKIVTLDEETLDWETLSQGKMLFNFIMDSEEEEYCVAKQNEALKAIHEAYPEYTIINFIIWQNSASVEEFYKNSDIDFVGYSVNAHAETTPSSIYKTSVFLTPSLYFVNEDGHVAGVFVGDLSLEKFEGLNNLYFGETPIYIQK